MSAAACEMLQWWWLDIDTGQAVFQTVAAVAGNERRPTCAMSDWSCMNYERAQTKRQKLRTMHARTTPTRDDVDDDDALLPIIAALKLCRVIWSPRSPNIYPQTFVSPYMTELIETIQWYLLTKWSIQHSDILLNIKCNSDYSVQHDEQIREKSESGIRRWEEMWFKTTAEDGERGAAVTCDGRLFHRRAAPTGKSLCHRQWTDEYVERPETLMRQNVVVVWIQCLLVNVCWSSSCVFSSINTCLFY